MIFFALIADNATKSASFQVPWNATVTKDSQCASKQNILMASWETGNFSMQFASSNSSKYDLTSFVVNLFAPRLFNDSASELCDAA